MGLSALTTWDETNRVIDSGKSVWYQTSKVYGEWVIVLNRILNHTCTITQVWLTERFATKSYRYVGMTKETADACRDAMIEKYTRKIKFSMWDADDGEFKVENGGWILMADIQERDENGFWTVSVNVHEHDVRLFRRRSPGWIAEESRDYDD